MYLYIFHKARVQPMKTASIGPQLNNFHPLVILHFCRCSLCRHGSNYALWGKFTFFGYLVIFSNFQKLKMFFYGSILRKLQI